MKNENNIMQHCKSCGKDSARGRTPYCCDNPHYVPYVDPNEAAREVIRKQQGDSLQQGKFIQSGELPKMTDNLHATMLRLMYMTAGYEKMSDMASGLKLAEECGEVSTAILKGNGYLDHKTLDEDVMHEVADVMNVCIAILTSHYKDMVPIELMEKFTAAMEKKANKYEQLLKVAKDD